jgi:2-polyprenyl-6-methoxyphenol hydroxylase-like FAD-dependent oxidoreductase
MTGDRSESVVVLGAGIAGLCVALALAPTGRRITLLERDAPPPADDAEAVFDGWRRRGASQLRHSHAFLAKMRQVIAAEHPALLQALGAAGARDLRFADGLPETIKARYRPDPADAEMTIIVSRRTTMEMVIRRYVEASPNVAIRSEVFVQALVSERDVGGVLTARGFRVEGGETVLADLVIDAGGRRSPAEDWLADAGAVVPETGEDCKILYYTRFYAFEPGQSDPPRSRYAATGDLGYLKFAVFPADNSTFSVTMAAPEVEEALRAAVVDPQVFDAICVRLPGLAAWTDPVRARPVSKVYGMGDLKSRWREMAPNGRPVILNYFSVGDSLVRTNPLYGRGCSFAAVEAHLLRDVLTETVDPTDRARIYSERVRATLRPFYEDMLTQDRGAARRAEHGLDPNYRPTLRARLMRRFVEDGVSVAVREHPELFRAAMRAFHMLEPPRAWLGTPSAMIKVFIALARGRKANVRFYAPKAGPGRLEMFAALGLPAGADLERLRPVSLARAQPGVAFPGRGEFG